MFKKYILLATIMLTVGWRADAGDNSIPLDNWVGKKCFGLIEAGQFGLMVGAELIEDGTAWASLAATPGGGEHSNVSCILDHLNLKKDTLYNLFIHYKGSGGGGWIREGDKRRSFSFSNKSGEWQFLKIGPLLSNNISQLIIYGSSEVKIDKILVAEPEASIPVIDNYWYMPFFNDSEWEDIKMPLTWKDHINFGRCGMMLLRKQVIIPAHYKTKRGFFILRTGDITQQLYIYLNGQKLVRLKKNVYGIPNSILNYDRENTFSMKVTSSLADGCIVKGPIELEFISASHMPSWINESHNVVVKNVKDSNISIAYKKFNGTIRKGEICRISFIIFENDVANPGLNVKAYLGDESFPVAGNTEDGVYNTWVSSSALGKQDLRIEFQTSGKLNNLFKKLLTCRAGIGMIIAWSGITADLAANSSARLHCST
jgi:hypothetical protein